MTCLPDGEGLVVYCSGKTAEEPGMLDFMRDKPELSHKLMMALIKGSKKRKADAYLPFPAGSDSD